MANYAKCPLYPKQKRKSHPRTLKTTTPPLSIALYDQTFLMLKPPTTIPQIRNNRWHHQSKHLLLLKHKLRPIAYPLPQQVNSNQNSNAALITQTLQGIIQALTTLTAQISNMNFSDNTPKIINLGNLKTLKTRVMRLN
ncbi:hypothetical protein TNCV_1151241 [Trichonephila clavipes]|nr:hypothetical protein TNCV_1151241 [Trichonephila clavipes]